MKSFNRSLQSDSFSTQQRQKKFNRKNDNRLSRSKSNHSRSDSKSISKFFVRNLQTDTKTQPIEEVLNKSIRGTLDWSPPRRKVTPSKTEAQKKITFTKSELLDSQAKLIQNLQAQISKYKVYIYQRAEKQYQTAEQNKVLKQEVGKLKATVSQQESKIEELQQKIASLTENLNNREILLKYSQKQESGIKKVKSSIFQTRILEFQKQREELNSRIKDLEKIIQNNQSMTNANSSRDFGCFSGNMLDRSVFSEDEQLHKVESQLYTAKQLIKKLQISEACTKRKFYKEMQAYRLKRDKEYEDLKKKFSEFLGKYKLTMKKFASFQVKAKVEECSHQNPNSLQSYVSLTLSQDQQHV